jgi:hypothetical protein
MPRRRALLLALVSIGLAASVALGLRAAWPSPRQTIRIDINAAPLLPAGTRPAEGLTPPGESVPATAVHLDLPTELMRGRAERLALQLEAPAAKEALTLSAGIVSASLNILPPGESGQAFGPGARFAWTAIAARGSLASATIVLRVRRAGEPGIASTGRLLLARDVSFPVRSVFGLSAPAAAWTSGALAVAAVGLLLATILRRTH